VALFGALRRRPFLTPIERQQIDAGLATARRHAAAPIGLVIEDRPARDAVGRAQELFRAWDLPEAERQRAVLVYACTANRRFAVVGGDEIRRLAPPAFWESLHHDLTRHFEERRYCDGLFKAVANVAIQLQRHFGPSASGALPGPVP
jgi:uncharacterized membrane protein